MDSYLDLFPWIVTESGVDGPRLRLFPRVDPLNLSLQSFTRYILLLCNYEVWCPKLYSYIFAKLSTSPISPRMSAVKVCYPKAALCSNYKIIEFERDLPAPKCDRLITDCEPIRKRLFPHGIKFESLELSTEV